MRLPNTAPGQRVLVGEEAVVRSHAQLVAATHRLGDEIRAQLACRCRGHGCREEEPDMGAVARARSLDGGRETMRLTGLREGGHVCGPRHLVKIRGEEPTGVIGQEWVDPDNVTPLKMVEDDLVLDREEGLVRTLAALHSRLLANAPDPLVPARRSVSLAASPGVRPEPGVDVAAASKAGTEQRDLFQGGRRRWR